MDEGVADANIVEHQSIKSKNLKTLRGKIQILKL